MKPKQLTMVVVLAVVLGGIGYWISRKNDASYISSGSGLGRTVLPDFPLNDVTQVEIRDTTNRIHLVKQEGVWTVQERQGYPADYADLGDLLLKVWELKAVQTEPIGESGMARLQLLDPGEGRTNAGTLVVFKGAGDKELAKLILGKQKMRQSDSSAQFGGGGWPDGRWVYVPGGASQASLVSEAFSTVQARPADWIDKGFFKVEKFKSAEVTHPEATNSWRIYREVEGGELKMAEVPEGREFDTGKASSIGNLLSWPSFVDVEESALGPDTTGMDAPIVAKVETFEGFQYTVKVGKQAGTNDNYYLQVEVGAELPKERVAPEGESAEDKERLDKEFNDQRAKLQEKLDKEKRFSGWTYLVSKWTVENLMKTRQDFLKDPAAEGAASEVPAVSGVPAPEVEDLAGLPDPGLLPPLPAVAPAEAAEGTSESADPEK